MKNEIFSNEINDVGKVMVGSKARRNVKVPFLSYEESVSDSNEIEKGKKDDDIPIFYLDKLFEFNFSYNFEILKTLLEKLILNQQESQKELIKIRKNHEIKINEIEKNIIDMKIKISNPQIVEELKKEKDKLLQESEKIKKKIIREKNLELKEEKEANSTLLNNLEVSKKLYIY